MNQDVSFGELDKQSYYTKVLFMVTGARTALFPLQVIKTRLQYQNQSTREYNGVIHAFKKIFQNEGFVGFFKGYPVSMFSMPATFLYLTTLEASWDLLPANMPLKNAASGLLACTASQLWFVPCDIISQHQQINSNKENVRQQLRNTFDLAKNVYKNEGILGFYRGFILSMITFGPQSMLFWHIFGSARESLSKYHYIKERQNAHIGLSAAISSVLTNVFMTPLDTIRARYQLSTKKLSVKDVIKELWSNEGYKGFYKGYTARTTYGLLNSAPLIVCLFYIRRTSLKRGHKYS